MQHILEKHFFFIDAYLLKKKRKKIREPQDEKVEEQSDLMCSGRREMSFNQGSISWMEKLRQKHFLLQHSIDKDNFCLNFESQKS